MIRRENFRQKFTKGFSLFPQIREGVPEDEAVRIFVEFKKMDSAIKGDWYSHVHTLATLAGILLVFHYFQFISTTRLNLGRVPILFVLGLCIGHFSSYKFGTGANFIGVSRLKCQYIKFQNQVSKYRQKTSQRFAPKSIRTSQQRSKRRDVSMPAFKAVVIPPQGLIYLRFGLEIMLRKNGDRIDMKIERSSQA